MGVWDWNRYSYSRDLVFIIWTNPSEVPNITKPWKYLTMLTVWSFVWVIKLAYYETPSQQKRYPPTHPMIILLLSWHQVRERTGIPTVTLDTGWGKIFCSFVVKINTFPPKSATANLEESLLKLTPQLVISKQFWE